MSEKIVLSLNDEAYDDDFEQENAPQKKLDMVEPKKDFLKDNIASSKYKRDDDMHSDSDMPLNTSEEKPTSRSNKTLDYDKCSDDSDSASSDNDNDEPDVGSQLLVFAYKGNSKEFGKLVSAHPESIKFKDKHGWNSLHWCCVRGNDDIITLAINHIKSNNFNVEKIINAKEFTSGFTPMHVACINCRLDCITLLKAFHAKIDILNKLDEYPVDCIGKSKQTQEQCYNLVKLPNYSDSSILLRKYTIDESKQSKD